jgi:hypothetical protein
MAPTKEEILQGICDKHGISPDRCGLISRRLPKELQRLEIAGIPYQISYDPIYKTSFGNRNLVEIKMMYREHNLFIVIGESYPFSAPVFLIDKVCNVTKDCRIRDGLEGLPIFAVTDVIREFAVGVDTYPSLESDLISPKQIAEIWIGYRKDCAIREVADRLRSMIPENPPEERDGGERGERGELLEYVDPKRFDSEQHNLLDYMIRFTKFHHPTTTLLEAHAMMIECFEYY